MQQRLFKFNYLAITNYNIVRVNNYFEHHKPIEISEEKQHRHKKNADERQGKLFFDNPEKGK